MKTTTFDIRSHGAVGDGKTLNTDAFRAATEACRAAGGGTVLVTGGDYVTGTVTLFSNTELRVEAGAILRGSRDMADYDPGHLIHACEAENISITGPGLITGEGLSYLLPEVVARGVERPATVDLAATVKLHFASKKMHRGERPFRMIHLVRCRNVDVRNVRIEDPPGWCLSLWECDDANISGVRVRGDYGGENSDGIDLTGCRNVRVSGCDVLTGDDAIVIKNPFDGPHGRESRNIVVTGCTLMSSTNGFKIGTETWHDIRDVLIADCVIYCEGRWPATLTGISVESVDGATVSGVTVRDVRMRGVMTPFFVRLGNRGRDRDPKVPGRMDDIVFSGIVANDCDFPPSVTGIPGAPATGITLENVTLRYSSAAQTLQIQDPPPEREDAYPESTIFGDLPAYGLYARHIDGLRLRGWHVEARANEAREKFRFDDVSGLDLDKVF